MTPHEHYLEAERILGMTSLEMEFENWDNQLRQGQIHATLATVPWSVETPEVDYKELLRKYIKHVYLSEGSNFLNNCYRREAVFTNDEWTVLNSLSLSEE